MSRPGLALIYVLGMLTAPSIPGLGQLSDDVVSNANAALFCNMAVQYMDHGNYASARKYFDAAIHEDPGSYILYWNRAIFFRKTHQWQLALTDLSSCLRRKPTFSNAVLVRANINERLGKFRDSLADYNALVRIYPRTPVFLDFRAWLLATCPDASIRNGQTAIKDATAACRISVWNNPTYIDTLAAAYAESRDFESAIRFEEKAIARANKEKLDTTSMEKRLALFRQNQPHRELHGESPRGESAPPRAKKRD